MRFAVVGCGVVGQKRAAAISRLGHEMVLAVDHKRHRAVEFDRMFGSRAATDFKAAVEAADVDAVVVATPHGCHSEIATACLYAGKHVLVEKPGGRNLAEVSAVKEAADSAGRIAKVGYNHRFHPAVLKAREIVDRGELGPLMFIRGRYGHGGRLGYEKEWRLQRLMSGGGHLVDQGSHLIDLARWFLGDFTDGHAALRTFFWNVEVEDSAFITLSTSEGRIAWLHATCTEWKNLFSFEIYGRDGKLEINGLGGSYGIESISFYRMLPEMGPPDARRWEFPSADRSWDTEIAEFVAAIRQERQPIGNAAEALANMAVIERLYQRGRI
jgi:predicted dehydrogenase